MSTLVDKGLTFQEENFHFRPEKPQKISTATGSEKKQ